MYICIYIYIIGHIVQLHAVYIGIVVPENKTALDMKVRKACLFSFLDHFLRKETHLEETYHIYHLKVVYD